MASLPMASADPHASPSSAPPTLLFVDDEPSILSALRRLFRPLGYRILVAEGGAAALEMVAAPVDVRASRARLAPVVAQASPRWSSRARG